MPNRTANEKRPNFKLAFLWPKYWSTWFLFGLVALASSLPRPLSIKLGDGLGWLYPRVNKKRADIVKVNLALCFPELSQHSQQKLAADHFRFYGRSIIDLGLSWWAPKRRLAKLISFENEQDYLTLIKNHPVILMVPHMTTMDCASTFTTSLHPLISMMKAQRNELLTWQLWKGRTRFEPTEVVMRDQGLRPLIRGIKNKLACLYLPDEDFGDTKRTLFAPFFKSETSTLTTLSTMAKLSHAKVMPVCPVMQENGHYKIIFAPPLENFPSDDPLADATRVNQAIEHCISLAPEQYMWTFKWFKTQADGAPSPY